MQAAFEAAYAEGQGALERSRRSRLKRMQELLDEILTLAAAVEANAQAQQAALSATGGGGRGPAPANPMDSIARLADIHKRMCDYVVTYLSVDRCAAGLPSSAAASGSAGGRSTAASSGAPSAPVVAAGAAQPSAAVWEAAQKEIALALDSVYPRVNVRQFASLPSQEAMAQLDEIAHLVLGIRLFNWTHGRGGLGIVDTAAEAERTGSRVLRDLERCLAACNETCQQYSDALLALRAGAIAAAPAEATAWPSELANRRQLGVFAASLADELRAHLAALADTAGAMQGELKELTGLAGSRASLAKEVVYPRFHNVAARWLRCAEIGDAIDTVAAAHAALASYMPATLCTLGVDTLRASRAAGDAGALARALPPAFLDWVAATNPPPPPAVDASRAGAGVDGPAGAMNIADTDPATPTRLALDHSAEVMQQPLEFQGYCPVSLAAPVAVAPELQDAAAAGAAASVPADVALGVGMGALLAGDPSLGIVRWQGRHYMLSSEAAVAAFNAAPGFYARRVCELALQHLELVHLLQLLSPLPPFPGFCDASLPALLQFDGDVAAAAAAVRQSLMGGRRGGEDGGAAGAGGADAAAGVRLSRKGRPVADACVETPVHFVDRHVDHRYEWNEWALRRKALALANLRGCATTSAQTDASHFRRDNDAQVYLPRAAGTQTGISVGTNTTIVRRHLQGLRGVPEAAVDAGTVARGLPPPSAAAVAAAEAASRIPYPVAGPPHDMTVVATAKPPSVSVTTTRPKTSTVLKGSDSAAKPHGTPPVAISVVTLKLDV
jgi:hypothetical protein